MKLWMDASNATRYTSLSQLARVLTERWVGDNGYCPNCGGPITGLDNNQPVADFSCLDAGCREQYELKSTSSAFGRRITDGAYATMIRRLGEDTNPNLFLLRHADWEVQDFLLIPKHFFIPELIEKRKPLANTARRAGWIGCNILLERIPQDGRVYLVRDRQVIDKGQVLDMWRKTLFLRETHRQEEKGWLLDVMNCIQKIGTRTFTLKDLYALEHELAALHPANAHVRDKIRQKLQVLRDKGYLDFVSRGLYRLR